MTLLVNAQGQLVSFLENDDASFFVWETEVQRYSLVDYSAIRTVAEAWGGVDLGTWTQGLDKTITVDGVEYTFTAQGSYYVLTPSAGTYSE